MRRSLQPCACCWPLSWGLGAPSARSFRFVKYRMIRRPTC